MRSSRRPEKGLGFLLADVSRLLRRDFDRRVRDLGMTQAQWRAIAHLSREEGINQTTLAERLEIKPITLTRLIDRMQAAGWVRREADASDRRAQKLYLTPKAAPILDELHTRADAMLAALTVGVPVAARRQLIATLDQLKLNLLAAEKAAESVPPGGDHVRQQARTG
jgi:MarR family transcriptional regulator, transcriptional regulator for hemolysin